MPGYLKFFLLTAALLVCASSRAQTFYFRHYEVESGLSNNAVFCSMQDKTGFMWFGTRDGLNRFNGYTFKTYRFAGNNLVRTMLIDSGGALVVATEKDIYKYDPKADNFSLMLSTRFFPIDEMASDRKGNIWFNAGGILSVYTERTGQLKIYDPAKFFFVTSISVDGKDNLWVATANGFLQRRDAARDTFTGFNLFAHSRPSPWSVNNIECISGDKILVGTDKSGFKIFDIGTASYKDIRLGPEKLDNLFIRSFLQVSPAEIWIGTETGIFIYYPRSGKVTRIQKNSSDPYALSDNVIYTMCRDREGGIWVGSYFGGINYYPKQFTPFQKYYQMSSVNPLSGNIIREVTQDAFGNLWIGTEDAGLNKLDAKTGRLSYYKPDSSRESISYISVHNLLPVGKDLWIGTYEHGLDIMDIATGKVIRRYSDDDRHRFKSKIPFCFLKSAAGEIIVGATSGIFTYNAGGDYFEPLPGFDATVLYNFILKDSQGTLWAAIPGKGVRFVNARTGISGNFTFKASDSLSISSDKVNSIFEDSKRNLWFLTENGLCRWNSAERNFTSYGVKNGFPSNFMLSMLEDEKGYLWISTTKGLVSFDPRSKSATVYTTANGLLSDQFNFSSAFKDNKNRMYFGSAKGLISFLPTEFVRDKFIPPVYFTGLQIDNQEAGIRQGRSPLKQSIIYTKKIVLNYDQSTFSLDFAALGFTAPQNLKYAYRMDGLSNLWTVLKNNRKVNFTKLGSGIYTFRIKSSSSGGLWGTGETSLVIEILPPWWASNLAYLTYGCIFIFLTCAVFYYYHRRIEEKNKRKIELLEIAQEKELMQLEITKEKEVLETKIEFFTQVAHEIRTPLTLIKIPLGKVIRKTAGMTEIENSLKIIGGNTDRLIELSNQLLDFRQTELKAYHLQLNNVDISLLLNEVHINFQTLAEQNGVLLETIVPESSLFADIDTDAFTKIVYNLYSNAIKYAATHVRITMSGVSKNESSFTIRFTNDGHLIPDMLREKIFEPFFRIRETETKTGSGIGLALASSLAQLHGGSLMLEAPKAGYNIFLLTLPLHNHEAYRSASR